MINTQVLNEYLVDILISPNMLANEDNRAFMRKLKVAYPHIEDIYLHIGNRIQYWLMEQETKGYNYSLLKTIFSVELTKVINNAESKRIPLDKVGMTRLFIFARGKTLRKYNDLIEDMIDNPVITSIEGNTLYDMLEEADKLVNHEYKPNKVEQAINQLQDVALRKLVFRKEASAKNAIRILRGDESMTAKEINRTIKATNSEHLLYSTDYDEAVAKLTVLINLKDLLDNDEYEMFKTIIKGMNTDWINDNLAVPGYNTTWDKTTLSDIGTLSDFRVLYLRYEKLVSDLKD